MSKTYTNQRKEDSRYSDGHTRNFQNLKKEKYRKQLRDWETWDEDVDIEE
jgi:hypothetical protein